MAVVPLATLSPPVNTPALNDDGLQSPLWQAHHQDIVDQLSTIAATMHKGVTDGSEANAGDVGEYMTATVSVGLTNGALANVVSLDLPAGDWDVAGNVVFAAGSGTHGFFGAGIGALDTFTTATFPTVALNQGITTATRRYNVTGTTTVWLVAEASFAGTCSANGTVWARRAR